jgi:Tfp pilus assembly protein PilE
MLSKAAIAGFTIIELAVVFIIIGLLAAIVLVGRDLIHTAEIVDTIRQVDEYNTAVAAFQTKYYCLPGDCANAGQLGFDPESSGNGDGVIGGCSS